MCFVFHGFEGWCGGEGGWLGWEDSRGEKVWMGRKDKDEDEGVNGKAYLKSKRARLRGFGEILAGALFVVCVELVVGRGG